MEAAVTPDHSEEFNAVTAALPAADADIQLDYAGDVANAAKVIAALYRDQEAPRLLRLQPGRAHGGGTVRAVPRSPLSSVAALQVTGPIRSCAGSPSPVKQPCQVQVRWQKPADGSEAMAIVQILGSGQRRTWA